MAIASSGAVSFDDLRTEFNASGSVSFSDFYRGAATNYIRANAANNSATNLAASVPTSGTINFTNFRGAARGFRKTYASNATDQNASSVFGTDWGVDYPKDIVINSGVTLGATSTSEEALEINTGGLGTITITNNGTLIGAGGAAGGGAGGDAFEAAVACTFVNNGFVYAGGGGGGNGGTGGQGSYTTSSTSGQYRGGGYAWNIYGYSSTNAVWAGSCIYCGYGTPSSVSSGGCTYYKGSYWTCNGDTDTCEYYIYRSCSSTSYSSGGGGGAGGAGAGYNQSAAAGASGSSGGTNAGSGGSGGTGGGYGASGSNGSTGANGNYTNGSAGTSGGAGGKYIRGVSNVTFTNNGTVAGGTA